MNKNGPSSNMIIIEGSVTTPEQIDGGWSFGDCYSLVKMDFCGRVVFKAKWSIVQTH